MTNLPQTSSSIGAFHLLPPEHHEFEELCALALAGELTAEEQARLDAHLEGCESCRTVWDEYHNDAARVLAVIGAMTHPLEGDEEEGAVFDLEAGKRRLFADVDQQERDRTLPKKPIDRQKLIITLLVLTTSLALFGAAIALEDHLQRRSEIQPLSPAPVRTISAPIRVATILPTPPIAKDAEKEVVRLRGQVQEAESTQAGLQEQLNDLSSKLEAAERIRDEQQEQNARLTKQIEVGQAEIASLHQAAQSTADTQARVDVAEREQQALQSSVAEKDRVIASDTDLLAHDRDIRDLIGARNLLIEDIYDVGQDGKRNQPFGRIFYTKDKSLIFYGYDLDKQPGLKKSVTFQAWGRNESGRDVNLGLFYQDATSKRWALKFSDATTLARLRSVFVTVEPAGGSDKPSGKTLLSTSLRIDANHP